MELKVTTTLEQLAQYPADSLVVWAIHSCWWNVPAASGIHSYKTKSESGDTRPPLPCDPRGSVLMQGELGQFLESAQNNSGHYGVHGLRTLEAAFHGNLVTDEGLPTSLNSWPEYDALIPEGLPIDMVVPPEDEYQRMRELNERADSLGERVKAWVADRARNEEREKGGQK